MFRTDDCLRAAGWLAGGGGGPHQLRGSLQSVGSPWEKQRLADRRRLEQQLIGRLMRVPPSRKRRDAGLSGARESRPTSSNVRRRSLETPNDPSFD